MKVGYLIIGRLKSTRLPKKLLIKIKGKPIISHLIDRLKLSKKISEIIICTSTSEQDKPLAKIAIENNVNCYFGDPDDVLLRMFEASQKYNLDYILTITADSPFVDPNYADAIIEKYIETDADLIRQFDLPHGVFSYGIKVDALKNIIDLKDSSDTEVWGRYFTDTGLFKIIDFDIKNTFHKRPGLRMTLDYPEDLEFFKIIFDSLYENGKIFSLDDILKFLDKNPKVLNINKNCGERFLKNFRSNSDIKLKKKYNIDKAIIIGCGSIGKRHINNLKTLGVKNLYTLRTRKGHQQDLPSALSVIELNDWEEVSRVKPDIAIISNPTSLHIETAMRLSPFTRGIFIEKPISDSLVGLDRLSNTIKENNLVLFMGYNLMFHPIIQKIKEYISSNDLGKLLNIQCQVGHWLPDWHPYENYKESYSAKKELGGGVSLTLIHEIHLAIEFAGKPLEVFGMNSKTSLLEIDSDIDVISDIMIKHNSDCVSQIHLDYIQNPSHRSGILTFEKGWISYDFNELKVFAQTPDNKLPILIWSDKNYDSNLMYLNQLKCFINYVEEGRIKHSFDIISGIDSLWTVKAYHDSVKYKKSIHNKNLHRFEF